MRFLWACWCSYALLIGIGIAQGGMWLDEMQVWCLGRDHHGVGELLHALRNEGHPPLWPLLVHALTVFWSSPLSMAVLHGLFAAGTAWLVLFRAPWPMWWRVLAVCGYFLLFEYAIIARNYGPGLFFLCAAVAAHRAGRPWIGMLAWMALAMTHFWGIVLAGAWAFVWLLAPGTLRADRLRHAAVLAVTLCALCVAWPAAPLPYTPDVHRLTVAALPDQVGGILGQVFVPFPDVQRPSPWNTSWLLTRAATWNSVLGFACFAAAAWSLRGDRRVLIFFLLASLGVLAFPLLAPFQSLRYYGPIWLALLAAWWMAPPNVPSLVAGVLLALQLPGAAVMTAISWRAPRSTAERAVAWYRTSAYHGSPIVVHPGQLAPAVSGYLGRAVYTPAVNGTMTFCDWTQGPFRLQRDELQRRLRELPYPQAVLFADDTDLASLSSDTVRITPVQGFGPAQVHSEEVHAYVLTRLRNGR